MASSKGSILHSRRWSSMPLVSTTMSEVRIVLLGEDVLLTNRVGNFILGRSAFQTEVPSSVKLHCERASVQLEGRNITIINTPHLYNLQLSQEELNQRVKECISLIDPGPHVFLLVLQSGTLAHEQHDRVRHTLEIYSPLSRERSIVITTGEDHGVISECEARHHKIPNIATFNKHQVLQIFKKIDEVVNVTGGCGLQERKHLETLRRVQGRLLEDKAKIDGDTVNKKLEGNKLSDLRVILLGKSLSDISSMGNTILGRSAFETEDTLHTIELQCERVRGHVKGRYITLINAPHLFHQTLSHDHLTVCVKDCMSLSAPGPHVIVLIVQPNSFTEANKRRVDYIFSLLSEETHKYTMVVTTKNTEFGSSVDQDEENATQKIIAECNYRHLEFSGSNHPDIMKMMEEIVKVNKGCLTCEMYEDADSAIGQEMSEHIAGQLEHQETEKLEEHMESKIPETYFQTLRKNTTVTVKGTGKWLRMEQDSDSKPTPHLKLVLLGMEGVKASISKLLLGENPCLNQTISSSVCVKQGEMCGHLITLVEMPPLYNTQLSEQEVMHLTLHCVSVCDPGAHAFLIPVPKGPLTDEVKAEIETFQRIFSSRVNDHTIYLINQQSQREPLDETLQSVIKKYGGRYTFFKSNMNAEMLFNTVTVLLEDNDTHPYTVAMYIDAQFETQLQYKKEIENLQQQLKMSNRNQTQNLSKQPDTLRLVLLGKTGVGKSASGNTILGKNVFKVVLSAQSVLTVCKKETAEVYGRQITVVDTPGLFDTNTDNDEIKKEIIKCITMAAPGPHVFLLVLKIGQRFTEEEREAVNIIEKTFGKRSNMYTIVVFTRGDDLEGITIEEYIEKSGANLNTLLYACGNRYHVLNNKDVSSNTQVLTLMNKIDSMVKVNGGSCYTNEMFQEVEEALEEEKERILKEREEQIEREKEELKKKYEAEMEKMRREMQRQKERQEAEEKLKEEKFKQREEQIKREISERKEELREDFRKRKEEDDLKMKEWMQEINREKEENRKQWQRQREEDQKQRDQEEKERKRREEEWKKQQKQEGEGFKREKEEMKKIKEQELKKLQNKYEQKAAEEEKRRRDLEEKIKDAEESKKKELQDLQLSQQRDWERRMREEEEKRKEQEKNWEKKFADMEEKRTLDQSRKQEQYDKERQKEKEERELKEMKRKKKEEQEKRKIETYFNEKIRNMEERLKVQREKDERERRKKDEEHRKEMKEKLQKQQEDFKKQKEEEESKHSEETERNLAFIRDQHNRELEKLKRETEEAARKQAEEEFTAELDEKVKEAKEAGYKAGCEKVESERTIPGRAVDRVCNLVYPKNEEKKKKSMKT